MSDKKRLKLLQNMGIITLILVSLYYANLLFGKQLGTFISAANSILLPFGIALFLSYLLAPLVGLLENRIKIKKRIITVIIVFIILILVGAGFMFFVGITLYEQALAFIENDWENISTWVVDFVDDNENLRNAYEQITSYISFDNASPIIFNVVNLARSIGSITVVIVLIPVFLFFLLLEKENIFKGLVSTVPNKYKHHVTELGVRGNDVIQRYFNGRFLSMFIMSILFTIVFMVFGFSFERSLFFGFTLGFLDIIPYVGGFIGLMLPILFSFTVQDTLLMHEWTFVGLIIANIILQAFQGNILQPYIMGKEVNLHPLLVLSSFIFFGALFGITGIILAIPITGIIKTSVGYFNEEKNKVETKKVIIKPQPKTTKKQPKSTAK